MNVYVWERIDRLTTNWHSEGGLIVFAETEERARELAADKVMELKATEMPSEVRAVYGGDEAVYLFPDAGCC